MPKRWPMNNIYSTDIRFIQQLLITTVDIIGNLRSTIKSVSRVYSTYSEYRRVHRMGKKKKFDLGIKDLKVLILPLKTTRQNVFVTSTLKYKIMEHLGFLKVKRDW